MTQCNQQSFEFHPLNERQVVGRFDGGEITTDAGGLLLREVEQRTGIIARFAACFWDHRAAEQIEHTVIGALVRITVRRVWVSMAGGYPYAELFAQVYAQLRAAPSRG